MARETSHPASAGAPQAADGHLGRGRDRAGGPRYRFAAPVSVSRDDIAERIAHYLGLLVWRRSVVKPHAKPRRVAIDDPIWDDIRTNSTSPGSVGVVLTRFGVTYARSIGEALAEPFRRPITAVLRPPRPPSRHGSVQVAAQLETP